MTSFKVFVFIDLDSVGLLSKSWMFCVLSYILRQWLYKWYHCELEIMGGMKDYRNQNIFCVKFTHRGLLMVWTDGLKFFPNHKSLIAAPLFLLCVIYHQVSDTLPSVLEACRWFWVLKNDCFEPFEILNWLQSMLKGNTKQRISNQIALCPLAYIVE